MIVGVSRISLNCNKNNEIVVVVIIHKEIKELVEHESVFCVSLCACMCVRVCVCVCVA